MIFLDRDGVISKFIPGDYVKKWEEFEFIPGAIDGLRILTEAGYKIIIISNQAGVGKGLFSEEDLKNITEKMKEFLKKEGIEIFKVYYCIHREEEKCDCRKPKPGLLYKAKEEIQNFKFSETYFIGDSEKDIKAGKSAGTKTVLLLSGSTKKEDIEKFEEKPDFIFNNLKEAAIYITDRG